MTDNFELIEGSSNLPPAFGVQMPKGIAEVRDIIQQALEAWLAKTETE